MYACVIVNAIKVDITKALCTVKELQFRVSSDDRITFDRERIELHDDVPRIISILL